MPNTGSRKRKNVGSTGSASKMSRKSSGSRSIQRTMRSSGTMAKPGDNGIRLERTMRQLVTGLTTATVVSDNGGLQSYQYVPFQLDQLPGYTAFATCFQEYRIVKAVLKFVPGYSRNEVDTAVAAFKPNLVLGWFHDDTGVAIASPFTNTENAWIQREGYKQVPFSSDQGNVEITSYPSPLTALATAAGAVEQAIGENGQWISTTNVDVPHFGVKYRLYDSEGVLNTRMYGSLYVTYTIDFRQPR